MKHKFSKQIMSVLLAFVMVVGLIPTSSLTAFATTPSVVVTHDVDEIRELLRQDGNVTIKLDADAEKKLTAYSDFESYKTDSWNSQYVWTKIGSGNKTIDLNGYRLYVYDQSARSLGSLEWMDFRYIQGALLMEIPEGASLTVNDSNGGGMIWMDAEMPDKTELEGSDLLMERNIFAVTGGNLTVNGGEIHAGRSKEIYAQAAPKNDKDYKLIVDYTIGGINWYGHLYGYATWFLSGTAITAESGNVTINGGDIWGRGWDNWTLITRVPGAPNGADDFRDRCAALRLLGNSTAHIAGGNFYGRSDADAVQVSNPNNLTVDAGSFDVATNSWLVIPGVEWDSIGDSSGTADNINAVFFHDSVFEVHEGYLGSFGVPTECINDQSVKVVKGNTMTLSKNAIDPYIVIDDLNLYVNSPLDYGDISEEVYRVPEGCTVESVTWYKNGAKIENPESTYFQEGQRYSVYIALSVDIQSGTKFTNRLNDATINGKEAEINRVDDENLILSVDFGYCTAALEELEFEVIEPEEGQYANSWVDTSEYELYAPVGGYSNYGDFRTWYVSDDGENWAELDSEATFEVGKYYRFSFEVHAGEGQEFALDGSLDPDVSVTVNGIHEATVSKAYEQDPSEHIIVTVDFGQCPALISYVELTVNAPKEGETISYTVGSAHDTYYAIGDNSNYTDYRQWLESDTGYDGWRVMTPGETFKAGKYYKFITDIHTKNGYVFSTYDDGISIQPNMAAYVNDNDANVTKGYEQDPSNYITVEYFFGICYDTVVEKIDVENVVSPVAGKTPTYTVSIRGNGYLLEGTTSGNWKVNGIVWIDGDPMTGSTMDKTDTFLPGHTYTVMIDFVPAMGYSFLFDHNNSRYATVTVNGETANFHIDNTSADKYQVYYTFTCTQPEINTIMLYNLDAPVAGETPDTEVTAAYPEYYTVTNVTWLDEEDSVVNSFEQGCLYTAEITVEAMDYDGVDGCIFADEVTAYIDGKEVTGWTNSVTNINNTLTVRYGFRKPASAPIAIPYAFLTQPVGGTVYKGQTHTAYWQTTFIPTDTEIQYWDGEAWDQWDIQQAQSAVDSYDFMNVDAASYRFRIVAYIGNDAVATSNEFVITWENIPIAPTQITTQPKTLKIKAGTTAKFIVTATGTSLTYQWQSSADGTIWKNCSSSSATSTTFTFTSKASHNSNYYRCKITDAKGKTVYTDAVRLYVLGITTQPKTLKIKAGTTAKYTVKATGTGLTYQWQSSTNGKTWKNCSSSSATKTTFTFTSKTSHNSNYYRCMVKDNGGNTIYTDAIRLYVLGVVTQPKTLKIKAGTTAKYTVKATGAGLTYQWQSSTNGKTWKNCSSSSATKATFTFTSKTSHSSNYYRCIVKDNGGNTIYTDAVRLYVLGITEQPTSKTVTKGKTAKFTVEATGASKTYQWQVSTDGGKTWKNCSSASAKKATFSFTAKTSHNGNHYRCRIKDSSGNTVYTNKVKLTVK